MDTDDYFLIPTDSSYTAKRIKKKLDLMKEDIEVTENVVIAGSLVDWGDALIYIFYVDIKLITDKDLRIHKK